MGLKNSKTLIERDKILISQLTPSKFNYLADQNEWKEDPIKTNFDNFQMQKWILQTIKAQKVEEKMGLFV